MTIGEIQRLQLVEYDKCLLDEGALASADGELLWSRYASEIEVEFPSPKTGGKWEITPQGWVGHLSLRPGLDVAISPKVPVGNLFRMLEYAYDLQAFRAPEGAPPVDSLEQFLNRLAERLALGVLQRSRRGLYKQYLGYEEELPYLRGSLDWERVFRRPAGTSLPCRYEDQTADNENNRILSWTMMRIARSGRCSDRIRPAVRKAFRATAGIAPPRHVSGSDCVDRTYDRLSLDYRPLHHLCRFFLDNLGPSHVVGNRELIPFLVNMNRLFEMFVEKWLDENLPGRLLLSAHWKHDIDPQTGSHFDVDLVLSERETGRVIAVLDTKYKRHASPASSDVAQVVAYAEALQCRDAILIYPSTETRLLDRSIGDIRVRALRFDLSRKLDEAGRALLAELDRPAA